MPVTPADTDNAPLLDEALLARYAAQLDALRYGAAGFVECLVLSPLMNEHVMVGALEVLPESGPAGQYPGKQWWQGRRVSGRQISAVNAEVLDILDIPYDVPGDNLIIRGIDLAQFNPGDALRVGDAILIATHTPHRPCTKLAARTTLTKKAAIAAGRLRGTLFDTLRPATIMRGDPAERIVLPPT